MPSRPAPRDISARENYLRAVRFADPAYVPNGRDLPISNVDYDGVNPEDSQPPSGDEWFDFFGVGWRHELEGVMPFPRINPLADPDSWSDYVWPDSDAPIRMARARLAAARIDRSSQLLRVSHRSTLFERAWELVGMENLLILMTSQPERAEWLFDRIIEFQIGIARHYLDLKPDMAMLGDDLGTQLGLFISPSFFRRYFKPRYARLIAMYRDAGVLIFFHSCGNVLGLVPDFLDLGVDVLNPIQARAIGDLERLKGLTDGRMALHGGVDTQYTLTLGSPADVRAEVRERIRVLGRGGGYICSPDQSIPMPAENVRAFDAAVAEFGRYH